MTNWFNKRRLQLLPHITFGKKKDRHENKIKERSIVVAGSGPSLTEIDYASLPQEFETFRVNNFYFEDRYYLGRHVSYYFASSLFIKNQYFNIHYLKENNEYTFDTILSDVQHPFVKRIDELLNKEPRFSEFLFFYDTYYKHWINSGPLAFWIAIMLGYRKIYLTGIDFYKNRDRVYPWDLGKIFQSNRPTEATPEKTLKVIDFFHPEHLQIKALLLGKKVLEELGGEVYCVSPNSPLTNYIGVAPKKRDTPCFNVQDKGENYIKDWLPLPEIKEFE